MEKQEKQQCSAKVWIGWHDYPCSKGATVLRNDVPWCGTHDPEKIAAREAKRKQKEAEENTHLKQLYDRATEQSRRLSVGRPNGTSFDPKNPVTGVRLTFEEADFLILQLKKKGGSQ